MTVIQKLTALGITLFVIAFFSVGVHEQFHVLGASLVGIDSYARYTWTGGYVVALSTPDEAQRQVIRVAGGLGTAALLMVLWYLAHRQTKYTDWELDDALSFLLIATWQFTYAWFDGTHLAFWGNILGALTGLAVCSLVYGRKLIAWLYDR